MKGCARRRTAGTLPFLSLQKRFVLITCLWVGSAQKAVGKQNHIYCFRHSEDTGRLASCSTEASSDSLFLSFLACLRHGTERFANISWQNIVL